jgi:sugar lactone lactonase YvrE
MKNQLAENLIERIMPSSLQLIGLICAVSILFIASDEALAKKKTEKAETEEVKEYVWPAAPQEPVIKFVREFSSEKDLKPVKKKSRWKDRLLGEVEDEQSSKLVSPYSIHVDMRGRALIGDLNFGGLPVFDFENQTFSIIGNSGAGALEKPITVATDRFGRIYVTDSQKQKVVIYDQNGKFLNTLGGDGEFERPVGIAIDNQRERIYVSDTLKHDIRVFDFEGERISIIGKRGADSGEFNFPTALALDSAGRLYICDSMNFRIQVIDPESEDIQIIGEQGGGLGQFSRPKGVALDSDGNIYVSDSAFANVQIFNPAGQLLMAFGKAGTGPGEFNLISGLTVDSQDRIYIADRGNKRIQVFQYLGEPKIEKTED